MRLQEQKWFLEEDDLVVTPQTKIDWGAFTSGLHDEPIPASVRWSVRHGRITLSVLEFEPSVHAVRWSDKTASKTIDYDFYQLALPYVVMVVHSQDGNIGHTQVFVRTAPLESLGDGLCFPPLQNMYGLSSDAVLSCGMCIERIGAAHTLNGGLNNVTNLLFAGAYNKDLTSSFDHLKANGFDHRITCVGEWHRQSKNDPNFVFDVDWWPIYHSVYMNPIHNKNCKPLSVRDVLNYTLTQIGLSNAGRNIYATALHEMVKWFNEN